MKKILIVYASKTGSTATAAGLLAAQLTGRDVTLCTTEAPEADPTGYDIVVVGGSIRFSKLYKPVRDYLRKWDAVLAFFRPLCYNGRIMNEKARRITR